MGSEMCIRDRGLGVQLTWRSDTYYGSYLKLNIDINKLGRSADDISTELFHGDPSILMSGLDESSLLVWVYTLNDGEDEIIVERMREILT